MSVRIHEPPLGALKRAAAAFQSQPGVLSCVHQYDFPQWSEEGGMEGEQVHALLLVENHACWGRQF